MFGAIFCLEEVQGMDDLEDLIEMKMVTKDEAGSLHGLKVRRFKEDDAAEVRNLIVRNFIDVNSKDYA
jgi:hypothetical protein